MRALRLLVLSAALAGGCGAAPAAQATTTPVAVAAAPPADDPGERIRELESRLALRTAEVRELRGELEDERQAEREAEREGEPRGVVRIADARCDDGATEGTLATAAEPEPAPEEEPSGPRPVLRLYGVAPAPPAIAPLPGPTAPSVVPPPPQPATFARLPVTADGVPAIPESPLTIAPGAAPLAVAPRAPEDDPIVQEYQRALGDVEARRWDAALAGLERFARAHPGHPYADNAIYWQGEVLYARRDYRRALTVLEALVARYPDGNKVPDALLRIGYCLQRLGDPDRARETFRRVREQYPDTVAARMASREET